MKSLFLKEYRSLFSLVGNAGSTACEAHCDLCGKDYPAQHEDDCPAKDNASGSCSCVSAYTTITLGGIEIIDECCGRKILRIVADLLPDIAEEFPALLRAKSKKLKKLAAGLENLVSSTNCPGEFNNEI
jgi:hypothetical protein